MRVMLHPREQTPRSPGIEPTMSSPTSHTKVPDDTPLVDLPIMRAAVTALRRAGFKTAGDVRRASELHDVIGHDEMFRRWNLQARSGGMTEHPRVRPQRVRLRRTKGWRMPPNTVKADRTTRWGNPVVVGKPWDGAPVPDAARAVTLFRAGIESERDGFPRPSAIRAALRGKNLACWCRPESPCHVDVLLEIANAEPEQATGRGNRR